MHQHLLGDVHAQLRTAINSLYAGDHSIQRPADAWLQSFRSTAGSWKVCLKLLDVPDVAEHESYYAANNIKVSCQKHQDVLDSGIARELLAALTRHLQACLHKQQWASAHQLAAAVAALAVRATCLQPSNVLQEVQAVLGPAAAAANAAAAAAASAAAAAAAAAAATEVGASHLVPQHTAAAAAAAAEAAGVAAVAAAAAAASSLSNHAAGLHLQQDPLALAAALLLVTAFPDAALSRQTSVHPDRRTAIVDGLKHSCWPAPLLRAALCSGNTKLVALSCEALSSWCELGAPPRDLERHTDALEVLAAVLLGPQTAVKACDAYAALLAACRESSGGSTSSSAPSVHLLQQLLQLLQGSVLPALAVEAAKVGYKSSTYPASSCMQPLLQAAAATGQMQPMASAGPRGPAAEPGPAAYSAVVGSHLGSDAEAAFCRLLCSAASSLLRPVMQGEVQLQPLLELLLQQLLLVVCAAEDGTAMTAVDFWQDSYLATLQALPVEQRHVVLVHQQGVLQALTAVLVQRTQLSPVAAVASTADARDLPEEMRMVRRELASALRDIGLLLGPATTLSFVTQLVSSYYQHLCSTQLPFSAPPAAGPVALPGSDSSTAMLSALVNGAADGAGLGLQGIVAGLAAGADVFGTTSVAAAPAPAAAMSVAGGPATLLAPAAGSTAAAGSGDWLPLESALYAANVVLGKQAGEGPEQLVQQVVCYAAASVAHPAGSLKLSGTALTLLGGLAPWLLNHKEELPAVLSAASAALRSKDEKLARNAATCIQRLTSFDDLAVLLTHEHGQFVQLLLQEYQSRGGLAVRQVSGHGDDKPTEELLLLSLCSFAVAHTGNSADLDSILVQLVGPQLDAAAEQLTAALHGSWPEQQQRQLLLPVSLPYGKQQPGHQAEHTQQVPTTSVSCFRALANLVAGLPTGVTTTSLGVPVHGRHPRHQHQLQQQQQQQQQHQQHMEAAAAGASSLHKCPQLTAAGSSIAGEDDTSMCSVSAVSDVTGSMMMSPRTAAPGAAAAAGMSSSTAATPQPWRQQQQQPSCHGPPLEQQQQQPSVKLRLRQHQACFLVSQLLYKASHLTMLAMQVASKAAQDVPPPQRHIQFAQQLLTGVADFLVIALPAAVQYQHDLAGGDSSMRAAAALAVAGAADQAAGGCGAAELPASSTTLPSQAHPTNVLQPSTLLVQLCHLMQPLPAQLLQLPCCLQLFSSCVAAAAAVGALPTTELHDPAAAAAAASHLQQQQEVQVMSLLQGLIQRCLNTACGSMLAAFTVEGTTDPDHSSAAMSLATVCLQQCPGLLAAADVDALLSLTLAACHTYHLKQCTAVLDWIQVLVQESYRGGRQAHGVSHLQVQGQQGPWEGAASNSPGGDDAGIRSSLATTLTALRQRLEAGAGAQVVLALLLAAAGAMPPDVVLPISFCLHSVWLSVGRQLFEAWLGAAVLQLAPEAAPWQRQRHTAKITFISELTDSTCLTDTTRFKRLLKTFCGGKKKKGSGRSG